MICGEMKFALVAAIISLVAAIKVSIPEDVKILESSTGNKFAWIPEERGTTRAEAVEKCFVLGGKLADVKLNDDFTFLSQAIKGAAWINSFEAKSFDGACFAFFEGGAIAVPVGNCQSTQGVLCQLDAKLEL